MVLLLVLGLVLLLQGPKEFDWQETHKYNKEQPYDNDLIYELLKAEVDKDSFFYIKKALAKELKPSTVEGRATYVFIGRTTHFNEEDVDTLLAFVSKGNDAFISATNLDYYLSQTLGLSQCEDAYTYQDESNLIGTKADTTGYLNLLHPTLQRTMPLPYTYVYKNKPDLYKWYHYKLDQWCGGEKKVAKLGTVYEKINFIRLKYGNGYVYLHSTPIAFTNYFMRDSTKLEYAEHVFSHFPNEAIYWDEGTRYWHPSSDDTESGNNRDGSFGQSELKYILSQPASRWAFYTLLVGVVLYIMFYMKRRQRVIPVIEPYANTSVEYVQTVGGLYFMKQEHYKLAEQQFRLFLNFVRNRYRLPTQQPDEELIKKLIVTSKVEPARVRVIFTAYSAIAATRSMTSEQLISFNKYLEYFYKNCK